MSEEREGFVMYRSFYKCTKGLPDEDKLKFLMGLCEYALDDVQPDFTGMCEGLFELAKPQIDANNRRRDNGNKGGRPAQKKKPAKSQKRGKTPVKKKPNNNLNVTEPETETEPKHNLDGNLNETMVKTETEPNDNDKVKEKVKEKVNDKGKEVFQKTDFESEDDSTNLIELIGLVEAENELLTAQMWQEAVLQMLSAKGIKLNLKELKEKLKIFFSELKPLNEVKSNIDEYKYHFQKWLPYHYQGKSLPKQNLSVGNAPYHKPAKA